MKNTVVRAAEAATARRIIEEDITQEITILSTG